MLSALFGKPFASAFSWHSIRIGLACALHAANAPDAVIQLICRWASADSLKVYRQMGIEKNVFWTNKAYSVTFDATRVNNLPALDGATYMLEQAAVFSPVEAPTPVARRNFNTFNIPGGTVQAFSSDSEGLVGLTVRVPRTVSSCLAVWDRHLLHTQSPPWLAELWLCRGTQRQPHSLSPPDRAPSRGRCRYCSLCRRLFMLATQLCVHSLEAS